MNGKELMVSGSAAMQGTEMFWFHGDVATGPEALGSLEIYDLSTPESKGARMYVELTFLGFIDSLWSQNGFPHTDYLQRPDTTISSADGEMQPGGFVMIVRDGDEEGRFQFAAHDLYPFVECQAGSGVARVARRVFFATTARGVFPTRVVDVAEFSEGSGYTEVMDLKLEPLRPESPVAHEFTADSFRNYGVTYQVHRYRGEGGELAERIYAGGVSSASSTLEMGSAGPPGTSQGGELRLWLLWANGIVFLMVVVALAVRRAVARRQSS